MASSGLFSVLYDALWPLLLIWVMHMDHFMSSVYDQAIGLSQKLILIMGYCIQGKYEGNTILSKYNFCITNPGAQNRR